MTPEEGKIYLDKAELFFQANKTNYDSRDSMYTAFMKQNGLSKLRGKIQAEIHFLANDIFFKNN